MKKVFAIVLILIMLFSLVACGNKSVEKELIGNWVGAEGDSVFFMEFSKDSVVLFGIDDFWEEVFDYKGTYFIDKENSKIHITVNVDGENEEREIEYGYKDEKLFVKAPYYYPLDDGYVDVFFKKMTDKQMKELMQIKQNKQLVEFVHELIAE